MLLEMNEVTQKKKREREAKTALNSKTTRIEIQQNNENGNLVSKVQDSEAVCIRNC